MSKTKNLSEIIKANPGCHAVIDNDGWGLYKSNQSNSEKLADSGDTFEDVYNCGYGSGHMYGGDVLQALALIVGITVESV